MPKLSRGAATYVSSNQARTGPGETPVSRTHLGILTIWVLRAAEPSLHPPPSAVSGGRGLVYANKIVPSDRIDAAYATIFPSLTILKIVCAQVALALL